VNSQVVVTGRFERLARIIGAQVGVSLVMAAILLVAKGKLAAESAALGGSIAFIPAILYAGRMLAVTGNDPKRLLRAQYRAESFKVVGTMALFGATFLWFKEVAVVWMFATYFVALLVYWVALLFDH